MGILSIARRVLLAALAVMLSAPAASAQDRAVPDPGLEELMGIKVERVFGASRRLQPVTEAPSSVTIITAEEIERLGYRTLADMLRGVRGLYVSYDRNYSYLGARGFSLPGDLNTKILLLVDGHRMNDNIYDQAAIGPEFPLDVATFERVEIIRGPSSSMYGTNAFFAVVNVITRTGASQPGLTVRTSVGTLGTTHASVSAGHRTAGGIDVFLNGSVTGEQGPDRLYFAAFDSPVTNDGIVNGLDDEQVAQGFAQLRSGSLTIKAALSRREKGVPTAAFDTVFNDPAFRTIDDHGFVDVQWGRLFGKTRVDVRAYADRYTYDGRYPYDDGDASAPYYVMKDSAIGAWTGVDARAARTLPWRQRLTVGGEYRNDLTQHQTASYGEPASVIFDVDGSSTMRSAYVLDEISVHHRLLVDVGARYDDYSRFHRVTPRAALIFTPAAGGTFKYLYGAAFRAPSAFERDYYLFSSPYASSERGNELRAESITTHEVVWEKYTSDWFRSSVSGYTNLLDGLIRLDSGDADIVFFTNRDRALARGVEVEGEIRTRRGLQVLSSYTLQEATDRDTGAELTNSPRHLVKARLTVPLPRRGASVSAEADHLSARRTLVGDRIGSATIVDAAVLYPLREGLALTGRVQNLFDQRYADPGSEEHRQDTIEQNGRRLFVGLRWQLARH